MEPKRDTSKKLSTILEEVLRENNMNRQLLEHKASSLWSMVLGPTVNHVTRDVYVHNGVMFVELTSSVVRQELTMIKNRIMKRINEAVGSDVLTDIVFR